MPTENENGGGLITELCASFGELFLRLRQGPVATISKDVILEGLSAVRTDTLRTVMEKLLGRQSELKFKLEDNNAALTRTVSDHSGHEHIEDTVISDLRQTLQLWTLIWRSRAQLDGAEQITAPLLRGLIDCLSTGSTSSDSLMPLRGPLILALSVSQSMLGEDNIDKSWNDGPIWEIVLTDGDSKDLVLASAFATYVCATHQRCHLDALLYAEGWDYLRDVLLLILTHQFLDVEEPLALLVAPSICMALTFLITARSDRTVCILSSPWTMNLCIALKEMSRSIERGEDNYHQHLWRRIESAATELLGAMHKVLSVESVASTVDTPVDLLGKCRFISVRLYDVPQLLLVHL